jgi:hypothetical protein
MIMRKYALRIAMLALPLCTGAYAATVISDSSLEDQTDGPKTKASVPSAWSDPTTTVTEVTIPAAKPAAPSAPTERALSANPMWAMPLKQFTVTRERPIFSPSRRPPPPPPSAVTVAKVVVPRPKEPEQPQLSLVGTILGDEDRFGIFVDQSTKNVLRLRVGEQFEDWTLKSVQGREAAFQKNHLSFVVALPQPTPAQPYVSVRSEPAAPDNTVNLMAPGTRFRHDR